MTAMVKFEGILFDIVMYAIIFLFAPFLFIVHLREISVPRNEEEYQHSRRALKLLTPAVLAWVYILFLAIR